MHMQIGIVGCGVAGLSAALALARDGHRITLLERSDQVGPAGAGILLQPSGQLALARLGLLDQATAKAARIERLFAVTHRGRTLINLRDLVGRGRIVRLWAASRRSVLDSAWCG